jgi:hypothetical protein
MCFGEPLVDRCLVLLHNFLQRALEDCTFRNRSTGLLRLVDVPQAFQALYAIERGFLAAPGRQGPCAGLVSSSCWLVEPVVLRLSPAPTPPHNMLLHVASLLCATCYTVRCGGARGIHVRHQCVDVIQHTSHITSHHLLLRPACNISVSVRSQMVGCVQLGLLPPARTLPAAIFCCRCCKQWRAVWPACVALVRVCLVVLANCFHLMVLTSITHSS